MRRNQISEIFNAMEGRIIGIMKAVSTVYGCAAQKNDVLALKFKINVLESNSLDILMTVIKQITYKLPMQQVFCI